MVSRINTEEGDLQSIHNALILADVLLNLGVHLHTTSQLALLRVLLRRIFSITSEWVVFAQIGLWNLVFRVGIDLNATLPRASQREAIVSFRPLRLARSRHDVFGNRYLVLEQHSSSRLEIFWWLGSGVLGCFDWGGQKAFRCGAKMSS